MNKFRGSDALHCDYRWLHCTTHLKVAKRVDLKCSNHKKEVVIMWSDGDVSYYYHGNHITVYKYIKWMHCITLMLHNVIG